LKPSLSRQFAAWASGLAYEDLPAAVVDRAKAVTLQGLSSCLLGHGYPETAQALAMMQEEEGDRGGPCSVLVDGRRFSRSGAAFVNAEMMFAGGKWDTFRMLTHPCCAIVPAALAAAEITACTGREYLTGVAAGYEVMERLADEVVPTVMTRGFHAGPVFAIFGAAVAMAKIMKLDASQMHGAIAQCVNLAAGNLEGGRSGGRSIREGGAVRNAILAVAMGRQGVPGGETVLEGPAGFFHAYTGNNRGDLTLSFRGALRFELESITRGLGQEWRFLETLFRIYSTPGYNIAHIDVTARLCERDGIRAEDVESVETVVNWLETQYPSPAFPSRFQDLAPGFETPHYYAAYAILERGFPMLKDVEHGVGPADPPGLQEMMQRVRIVASHRQPLFAPTVSIVTRNGQRHTLAADGREFILDYDALASRLAPIAGGLPIPAAQYAGLVDELRQLERATGMRRLIEMSTIAG
jgi:hypothetical protein